jgi:hypothetical protein
MLTEVLQELTASIIRMMSVIDSVNSSETSVNSYQTLGCHNPEDNHLYTRRHENLKSHKKFSVVKLLGCVLKGRQKTINNL